MNADLPTESKFLWNLRKKSQNKYFYIEIFRLEIVSSLNINLVAGVILNGLNSGLRRLDCDFECDLPCLCNLYGFCFGFSQSDIVQFHILVNSVQVSGFKFFKNITIHIHRNRDVLVTEYFLQDLRRYAAFDAARGKGMTECMKMQIPDAAAFYDLFKMSGHLSGLHRG